MNNKLIGPFFKYPKAKAVPATYCSFFNYLLTSVVVSSKRVSGFDQAPQQAAPIVNAGALPGMLQICLWRNFALLPIIYL